MYPLDFAGFGKFTGAIAVAVCWIGLALLQTLWISLSAPLMRLCAPLKNKCGRWIYPFYAAAVWTFIEWTMTKTWLGVPFSRLALTQSGCLPMIDVYKRQPLRKPFSAARRTFPSTELKNVRTVQAPEPRRERARRHARTAEAADRSKQQNEQPSACFLSLIHI